MLVDRMIRAARLDVSLYEEVEHDLTATSQAFLVVVIVAIGAGVSGFLGRTIAGQPGQAVAALVGGIAAAILGWLLWSLLTYWIGTAVFGGTATPGEVLRTIGFANTPSLLQFFGFVPCVGPLIALGGVIWALVAGVIAIRQALDFDTTKAVLTVVLGWLAMLVVTAVLAAFGLGASFFL